jgi:hypothetical protein
MIGLHPYLTFAVEEAIKITEVDFTILNSGGIRTYSQQKKLVDRGLSKTLDSYHQYGLAVDLVAYVNGKPTWEEKYYPKIAEAMKIIINKYGLPIDNGFDLWGWDMPHWQLTGFKTKYDIRKYT